MAKTTIGFGVVLLILGAGSCFQTAVGTSTALIPAALGLLLLIAGLLGLKAGGQWPAVKVGMGLSALGLVAGVCSLFLRGEATSTQSIIDTVIMSVLSTILLGLYVKFFINRAASQNHTASATAQSSSTSGQKARTAVWVLLSIPISLWLYRLLIGPPGGKDPMPIIVAGLSALFTYNAFHYCHKRGIPKETRQKDPET